jgi:hypothetical protein
MNGKNKLTPATIYANTPQKVRKNYKQAASHPANPNEMPPALIVSKDSLQGKELNKVLAEFTELCGSVDKRCRYRVVLQVEKI